MTSAAKAVRLAVAAVWLGEAALGAQPDARELLKRVATLYRSMGASLLMRAEYSRDISLSTSAGRVGYAGAAPAPVRLLLTDEGIRIDDSGNVSDRNRLIRIWTKERVAVIVDLPSIRGWIERPATDPATGETRAIIGMKAEALYDRICGLNGESVTVTASKTQEVRTPGGKVSCLRLTLKGGPAAGAGRPGAKPINPSTYFSGPFSVRRSEAYPWGAEVWVDPATALVWRADWHSSNEDGVPMDERITYQEIVTGTAVPREEIHYRPPAEFPVFAEFTGRFPR